MSRARTTAVLATAVLATAVLAAGGCAAPPAPVHQGPVLLVTLGGVRADAVGFLGAEPGTLTPHLDALAAEADWAGAAVAPSPVGLASLASYATGLGAWAHGVGLGEDPLELAAELRTLAEALGERGYQSAAYVPVWVERASGWGQGFGDLRDLGGGGRAAGHLASLDGGRAFVWVHLADAEAPYHRQDAFFDRLPPLPRELLAALPSRLSQAELEALRDPASPATESERAAVATLYRLAVARADERLGELLAALEESGRWDDALVVVASTHGQELVEPGAWGLARERIEVPLALKLPRRLAARVDRLPGRDERPAASRLWATIAEAVGAPVPPALSPSLLAAAAPGALSELYLGDGVNETSWVEADLQLLRRVRFAPADGQEHAVRLARAGAAPAAGDDPRRLLGGVERAFAATPAWAGRDAAETALVAWRAGGSVPVDDPARQRALAAAMERRRLAFAPCDETPAAAAARRAAERSAAAAG